ncbi:carboxymuconolactone decarboxylase family protein [Cohnella endophytica]|uniref:Carboxymuconolactone decarboxylase family protein n=1 Tax=Cohnella endophytica TaxID=2419778 RepID=A0A494XWR6_9BACL|nr:carboxymuconolactone decarboxylase family protein [Cohnella endophytica]
MTLMEQKVKQYNNDAAELGGLLPEVAQGYERFTGTLFKEGALDAMTKQLVALGVALFANNEVCTYYHVQAARDLGASDLQIMETAAVASAAASGHVMSQGVIRVQSALGQASGGPNPREQYAGNDAELSEELDAPGMSIPGSSAVSPSY